MDGPSSLSPVSTRSARFPGLHSALSLGDRVGRPALKDLQIVKRSHRSGHSATGVPGP